MQLHLSRRAREILPLIRRAAEVWNRVLPADIIEVSEAEVSKEVGPTPTSDSGIAFYRDGVSVVYIPQGFYGLAVNHNAWDAQTGTYVIDEADVFVGLSRGDFGYTTYETLLHELGHALGLAHISVSGSIMSYDSGPQLPQRLGPFGAVGQFPYDPNEFTFELDQGDFDRYFVWRYLLVGHPSLLFGHLRPSAQDKLVLSCLYGPSRPQASTDPE